MRRCGLVQPEEPERIVPRLTGRGRPRVLGPGGGALAREPVPGVEAPQPAEAIDPAGRVVDEDRRPAHVAARSDDQPVPPRVVDERDAQGRFDAGGQIPGIVLPQDVAPEPCGAPRGSFSPGAGPGAGPGSRTRPARNTRRASRPRRRSPDGRRRRRGSDRPSDGASHRRRSRGPRTRTSAGWARRHRRSSSTTKACSRSASWSFAPKNEERQSFMQ